MNPLDDTESRTRLSTASDDRSPLARPRADAVRNRARVLAAAEELFAERGPEAQLADIAERARVGAGTVYRHFPTKEALLREVVALRLHDLLERADALMADCGPGEAFYAFWALAIEQARRNAALCDAFAGPREGQADGDGPGTRFRGTLGHMLEAAQAAGAVRGDIDVADATAILGATVLAEQRRGPGSGPGRLADILATALRP